MTVVMGDTPIFQPDGVEDVKNKHHHKILYLK